MKTRMRHSFRLSDGLPPNEIAHSPVTLRQKRPRYHRLGVDIGVPWDQFLQTSRPSNWFIIRNDKYLRSQSQPSHDLPKRAERVRRDVDLQSLYLHTDPAAHTIDIDPQQSLSSSMQ